MHHRRDHIDDHLDDEFEFDEMYSKGRRKSRKSKSRHSHRLNVKKRMDDYEEHLWRKRNGRFVYGLYQELDENPLDSTIFY